MHSDKDLHCLPALYRGRVYPKLSGEPQSKNYFKHLSVSEYTLSLILSIYFIMKMSAYCICCIYSNAPNNFFTVTASTMDPDQTAPKRSSLIWVHTV